MEKGILYGAGIGPGDSELITLKALRIIEKNRIIAVPRTKGENNLALDIVSKEVDLSNKELLYLDFPMTNDKEKLDMYHKRSAEEIKKYLDTGENVVFISIGDISVYSTFGYVEEIVKSEGYKTEMIPGVPSFCAVSSLLDISLTDKKKPLHIIPAVYGGYEKYIDMEGTKVLMKSGSSVKEIKKMLEEKNLLENSYAVCDCGLESQKVFEHMKDIDDKLGYFTTIIVKDRKDD